MGSLKGDKGDDIDRFAVLLDDAKKVWIGAGAGLSAAADPRYDYMDEGYFARHYPALLQYGLTRKVDLMGYGRFKLELQWGYYLKNVLEVRFSDDPPKNPVHERLLDLVKEKDYFVITTNVDALFERHGFDPDKLYTPQGDYARMQCLVPCSDKTWPTRPVIDRALPTIDPKTGLITDPSAIPRCPKCGTTDVFLNVRGMDQFIEAPFKEQEKRYRDWLRRAADDKQLLVIDIGSGFNTPVWVRFPAEKIVARNWHAHLVRINRDHPEVPAEIADRAISFAAGAFETITAVLQRIRSDHH